MPADYLSRNFVNAISWSSEQQQQAQSADSLLKALKFFAKQRAASQCQKSCTHKKLFSTDGFIENRIIWCCNQKVVWAKLCCVFLCFYKPTSFKMHMARRCLENKRMPLSMFLLTRHGCSPPLPTAMPKWLAAINSSVVTSTANWAWTTCPCWPFWPFKDFRQRHKGYFLHDRCIHKICQAHCLTK